MRSTSVDHEGTSTRAVEDPVLRLAAAGVADEIEFLLARARTTGIIRANRALEEFGMKVRHYTVLSLAASGLRPSQRELADFLQLDPSQIVATIDALESEGWVERTPSLADRRVKVLSATDEGQEVLKRARRATQAAEDDSLASLSPSERDELRSLLRRIAFI